MGGTRSRKCRIVHYLAEGRDLFGEWLDGLKDIAGRAAVLKRIDRLEDGNPGDHRPVGGGVFELRIHHGPGYRAYYGVDGVKMVLLLCGGDKKTQKKDIRRAREFWNKHRRLK
ncbi:MAG: addiction module killer protein [Elusimicrobia bacterium CG_4_9_14_3_um_filter_62_55]|nr:MAG: addiction module killer protein [Elusimicrobia bacterium CG_4_9_14_3_um_filter_62_55]